MARIRKTISGAFTDGYKVVSFVAPLLSITFALLKATDPDWSMREVMRELPYAWAMLPVTGWLFVAYVGRFAAFDALERDARIIEQLPFYADMHPKDVVLYLCRYAKWSDPSARWR